LQLQLTEGTVVISNSGCLLYHTDNYIPYPCDIYLSLITFKSSTFLWVF